MKTLKWFKSHIGKRIYRNHVDCCSECSRITDYGLIVSDAIHAEYLFDTQNDYAADKIKLNYREKI